MTGADVGLTDTLAVTLNPLPVVALATALAVPLFGAAPRLTVPVSAAAAAIAYLIEATGPALNWPDLVLGVSPFHHVASVPAEPFEPALVMVASTAMLAVAGMVDRGTVALARHVAFVRWNDRRRGSEDGCPPGPLRVVDRCSCSSASAARAERRGGAGARHGSVCVTA